jgi:hypothetical protein
MIFFLRRHTGSALGVVLAPALACAIPFGRLCVPLLRRFGSAVSSATLASVISVGLIGCAPSVDAPNPWAGFRPASQISPCAAPAVTVDEHPPQPPIAINVDVPRFDLSETNGRRSPRNSERPDERYPPPAPPAEEPQLVAANGNPDVPAHWTGAVIYCQPGCVPCAMLVRDLRKAGWKCGIGDSGHFKIVELLTLADFDMRGVPSTPQTVYYIDGAEQPPRVTGYGGTTAELVALVNRHPKAKRSARVGTALSYGGLPLWYETPQSGCGAPLSVSLSNCGAPTLASCAAPLSSSSACSVPTTVTYVAPPLYVASPTPVYANSGVTLAPATHSAQLNLFGFPLVGGSIGSTLSW